MRKEFEAPELTVIGKADEVIMGGGIGTSEVLTQVPADFEFEED
jgi:hypothetical protein